MNFSDTRRTGRRAELATEDLFTSWSWIVGHDAIDEGYDLNVEPDRGRYNGARFLVQVKGTSKPQKGKAISAILSKNRLQQYLKNPHPVIIVRSTADGTLHWIHAQAWCQANKDRIASGSGSCSVRIDKASKLEDRESFELFLDRVLAPGERRPGALAALAVARGEYLSSLDSRLQVRTSVQDGHEQHAIHATSDEPLHFQFQARALGDGARQLQDAIEFGVPAALDVEEFRLTGSPLFDAFSSDGPTTGRLVLKPTPKKGCVIMRPGAKFSPFSPELRFDAVWTNGIKGASITNQDCESAFDLRMRLSFHEDGSGQATASIGFRSLVNQRPIAELHDLGPIEHWAEQIVQDRASLIELNFFGRRASLPLVDDGLCQLLPWIPYAVFLGRLHRVAKALRSDFVVPEDYRFSAADIDDVDLAYGLLKGERRRANVGIVDTDLNDEIDLDRPYSFHVGTTLLMSFDGQVLGSIPIRVDLEDYIAEKPLPKKLRLSKGEKGQAWISYCQEPDTSGVVSRSG